MTATTERVETMKAQIAQELHCQKVESKGGIVWKRMFSPTEDPFETIAMVQRDIKIVHFSTGDIVLQQDGVWFPEAWSLNACNIFSQHYLRGQLGTDERETSVLQSIDRVIDTVVHWAMHGRFVEAEGQTIFHGQLFADEESARNFAADMKYMIASQELNFNSPVWYNIGVVGVPQQCSACFILHVEDSMDSITTWYRDEAFIFKGGSGAGLDVSNIRSSWEGLRGGGRASGPVSFMRAADSSAGTMASGGRSRRAAKMVTMGIGHPDIYDQSTKRPDGTNVPGFIPMKPHAEEVLRVMRDAGFDTGVDTGTDLIHVQYQNANISVRINNEFMEALLNGEDWQTVARRRDLVWFEDSSGQKTTPKYKAEFLWKEIARAAWFCADPGLQFDTTINHWHTTPAAGRINSSNPCSEYMHIDNSPCNLAATNLRKFLSEEDGSFSAERFVGAVTMIAISQTILGVHGDYPTRRIAAVARGFRQIGQGYTNLGAMLMAQGLAYDSDEARVWAAAITSLMQAALYRTSTQLAEVWGVYPGVVSDDPAEALPGFDEPVNREANMRVADMHREYHRAIFRKPTARGRKLSIKFGSETHIDIFHREVVGSGLPVKNDARLKHLVMAGMQMWDEAIERGKAHGYANAHLSVLAPMGTNGLTMDHDTSGIEPDMAVKKNKKKVSGDHMVIVNQTIELAVRRLGYDEEATRAIVAYVEEHNSVVEAPHLNPVHYGIFDTALAEPKAGRFIAIRGHQKMMAAAQPFISGAISKTVNCPESTTIEEVEQIHFDSWRYGLKSNAIYRDNSKQTQPVSAANKLAEVLAGPPETRRHKPPRYGQSTHFKLVVNDFDLYVHVDFYDNGHPCAIFFEGGKKGSTLNGLLDGLARDCSFGLQHGTPMMGYIKQWLNQDFEPKGALSPQDSEFTSCSSVLDLLARELALRLFDPEIRQDLGIKTREERKAEVAGVVDMVASETVIVSSTRQLPSPKAHLDGSSAPMCHNCGNQMRRGGSCFVCPACGATTGCS